MKILARVAASIALGAALSGAARTASAADAPGIAFDQLDLPVQCESGCTNPLRGPGHFEEDYADFLRAHPDYKRLYAPGLLYKVAEFHGWTRVETQGVVTICSPAGDDLIVLDPAHRLYVHSKKLMEEYFKKMPGGCRTTTERDYYSVTRLPGTLEKLPAIAIDGISAPGRTAKYTYRFTQTPERSGQHTFRVTSYVADLPEPCPAPRALPIMSVFGNNCVGDKRFLVYRTSLILDKGGARPGFLRDRLGILNERGHIHRLTAAGDLFSIPPGYRDACAPGGHDTLGLCGARKFQPPPLLRDKD